MMGIEAMNSLPAERNYSVVMVPLWRSRAVRKSWGEVGSLRVRPCEASVWRIVLGSMLLGGGVGFATAVFVGLSVGDGMADSASWPP